MSDAKHTPTPWTTSPCPTGGAILHRGGGNSWEHPQGMLQIVPIEDAEFIALAVNSHHEQEKRITELEGALRPFAALALHYPTSRKYGNRPTTGSILHVCSGGVPDAEITVEAIHKAAQLLEGK